MLRQALRPNLNRKQTATTARAPAPTSGWNAIDALAAMKPEYAVVMDNWIPRPGFIEVRKGSRAWVVGSADPVESLIPWRGGEIGQDQLFACAGTGVFDLNTFGENWGSSLYTLTSPRVETTQFANDGGAFVICANGADAPFYYDGTSWTGLTITGSSGPITLDPTKLTVPCNHENRLHFIESGTLRTWFLDTNAIEGAAQLLDLSPLFSQGGEVIAAITWPKGSIYALSQSDLLIFMTTKGEIAVYQGDDPSDANYWSLLGIFQIGQPMGTRSLIKFGADVIAITTFGTESLGQALQLDRSQQNTVALTQKIQNAFQDATQAYASNFGWDVTTYPQGGLAIINVPVTELGTSMQFVQNIQTGAWCRFLGLNAYCWEIVNDNIFFGTTDGVHQWDMGVTDNGTDLVCEVLCAYNYFGNVNQKNFTMCRPILNATANVFPAIEIDTDFQATTPIAVPTVISGRSMDLSVRADWNGAQGVGFCGAVHMQVTLSTDSNLQSLLAIGDSNTLSDGAGNDIVTDSGEPLEADIQFINADILYEAGGPL